MEIREIPGADTEWVPPPAIGKVTKGMVDQAKLAWQSVLQRFGAIRSIGPYEELDLARAIQRFGSEHVLLALLGAENDPSSETYHPGDFLSLKRILDPEKFERFVNIGAQIKKTRDSKSSGARAHEERIEA